MMVDVRQYEPIWSDKDATILEHPIGEAEPVALLVEVTKLQQEVHQRVPYHEHPPPRDGLQGVAQVMLQGRGTRRTSLARRPFRLPCSLP